MNICAAAAALIGAALKESDGALNVDRILIPLRAGYSELERAADALPGFEKGRLRPSLLCGRARMTPAYSLWVMEYAAVPNYPQSGLIYGMHNQGTRKLPYCYIVIKGQGQLAMVDVGYNHKAHGEVLANTYGVRGWHPPREVLGEIGIQPIRRFQHLHHPCPFRSYGQHRGFPERHVSISQERELSKWVWTMSLERRFRWLMLGIDPADIMRAVDLARQGRLVCVDGDRENVLPGVDLHAAFDTHTWGSMYVTVRNDLAANSQSSWVFCGDLAYTLRKLARPRPRRSRVHSDRLGHGQPVQRDHDGGGDGEERGRRCSSRNPAA